MGNGYSEPVTNKKSRKISNSLFNCGSSSMQGWRMRMEDAHSHILEVEGLNHLSLFAIFDGHGGADVAHYANKRFIKILLEELKHNRFDCAKALTIAFLKLDNEIKDLDLTSIGSTANVLLIVEDDIYCANIGDSRSVASVGGMALELSEDHKPNSEREVARITQAGGFVSNYRVNGALALSRALGDFYYKSSKVLPFHKQMVIAVPDITTTRKDHGYEFIVMACDGIWDVMTSQEVVNFVRLRIANAMQPDDICEELMNNCLAPDMHMAGMGCDNMTAIVICFLENKSYKNLSASCRSFVPFQLCPKPQPVNKILVSIEKYTSLLAFPESPQKQKNKKNDVKTTISSNNSNDSLAVDAFSEGVIGQQERTTQEGAYGAGEV